MSGPKVLKSTKRFQLSFSAGVAAMDTGVLKLCRLGRAPYELLEDEEVERSGSKPLLLYSPTLLLRLPL
jgi:hypothetical protein